MIATRCAGPGDTSRIHEIFLQAFGKEDESDLWAHLLANNLLAPGDVRLANEGMAALYASTYDQYPCAIGRDANPQFWSVRLPAANAVRILPDRTGYAVIHQAKSYLWVREAAATDVEAGRQLLAAIGQEASERGREQVNVGLPPDHLLTRLLRLVPSRQVRANASPGMVIIADWSRMLPNGYAISEEGLLIDGRLAVRAGRQALTQLVMGYRCADELPLMADVQVTACNADWSRLRADFPAAFPKWSLDPFWEGASGA